MTGLKCGVIKSSTNLSVNILTLIAKTLMNVDSWWWFFYFVIHWMSSASVWDSEISELEAYFLLLFLKIYHFIWKNKHSYRERRRGRETASRHIDRQTQEEKSFIHCFSLCVSLITKTGMGLLEARSFIPVSHMNASTGPSVTAFSDVFSVSWIGSWGAGT